jgi:murein DD-endopeptidase MepM/ murein hydrolase activator NlpD
MARIAEDTAKSMTDPYTRMTAQQTWSVEGLITNMAEQQRMLASQMETLAQLREEGLSQAAIDQLGLADPANAMQTSRLAGMTKAQIDELNKAAEGRLTLGEAYAEESVDVRRMEEDRAKALRRQAEDFERSLARQSADFRRNMSRTREDFHRSMERSLTDFNTQMSRSAAEFHISMQQQETEFNISMDQQRKEFTISMAQQLDEFNINMAHQMSEFNIQMEQAREDHQRTLRYMEEDQLESQLTMTGNYAQIAEAFMAALDGDMSKANALLISIAEDTADGVSYELGLMPDKLADELGDEAWMFGLKDPPRDALEKMGKRAAGLIADGFTEELAKKIAAYEYKIEIGEINLPDHLTGYGRGGSGGVGYTPAPGAGRVLSPASGYRVGRGSGSHGYNAIDLPAPGGTPIFAPWSGTLRNQGYAAGSYGNWARLTGAGKELLIAHMSRFQPGGYKKAGDVIGYVGTTGKSSGTHLHAEVGPPGFGGATSPWHPSRFLKYDTGGILPHGGGAVNLSGKPEAIITNDQWTALRHLGDELHRLNSGVQIDARGMGVIGEVLARNISAWDAKAVRTSAYATKFSGPTSQTFDQSTQITGPIQVVTDDPVDMGRKIAARSNRSRAWKAGRR